MLTFGTEFVAGRECGSCVSCCCFFTIAELNKPAMVLCSHSMPGGGCDNYPNRPNACRVFYCAWRCWDAVPDDWRPDRTGFVLGGRLMPGRFLSVTADPARPYAWREEPYYSQLMEWARQAPELESQVAVFVEKRVIVLLPDGEQDLGVIGPDEVVIKDETGRIRKVPRNKGE
jgi:hypothetical protein